jgi:predicted nucleic acid-binding protein
MQALLSNGFFQKQILILPLLYYEDGILAMELSHRLRLSAASDAHYLALAEYEKCEFWTADARLFNAVKSNLSWVHQLGEH